MLWSAFRVGGQEFIEHQRQHTGCPLSVYPGASKVHTEALGLWNDDEAVVENILHTVPPIQKPEAEEQHSWGDVSFMKQRTFGYWGTKREMIWPRWHENSSSQERRWLLREPTRNKLLPVTFPCTLTALWLEIQKKMIWEVWSINSIHKTSWTNLIKLCLCLPRSVASPETTFSPQHFRDMLRLNKDAQRKRLDTPLAVHADIFAIQFGHWCPKEDLHQRQPGETRHVWSSVMLV